VHVEVTAKTVVEVVPKYQPATGFTSARVELTRALEWVERVSVRTPDGWGCPVRFEFRRDFIADTFAYRVG